MGLEIILPALIPSLTSGLGNLITKWTGGAKAQSVDDLVKLGQLEIDKMRALAELDNPHGTPSQWVVDLRGAFRYLTVIGIWVFVAIATVTDGVPVTILDTLLDLAGATLFFIIGERMHIRLTSQKATKSK